MKQSALLVLALAIGTVANSGHTQTPSPQAKPSAQVEKTKVKPAKPPKPPNANKSGDPKTTTSQADATAAAYKKGIQPSAPK
jgi:hypothetical protein